MAPVTAPLTTRARNVSTSARLSPLALVVLTVAADMAGGCLLLAALHQTTWGRSRGPSPGGYVTWCSCFVPKDVLALDEVTRVALVRVRHVVVGPGHLHDGGTVGWYEVRGRPYQRA